MEFETKKREREQQAEAKTAKNRAKRQKKKAKAKDAKEGDDADAHNDGPIKKRRMVNGKELVFRRRDDSSEDENENDETEEVTAPVRSQEEPAPSHPVAQPAADVAKIVFHEDD